MNLNNNNYENTSKTEEYDFLDNLNDAGLSKNINISPIKILDYGDVKKYKNQLQHRTLKKCRWFNNITVKKDIVVKSSNCEYGNEVMKNEINWYLGINNILGKEIFTDNIKSTSTLIHIKVLLFNFICNNSYCKSSIMRNTKM